LAAEVARVRAPGHDVPPDGRSGFTLVDGRQVHYLEWGAVGAKPVVCLHGGGQTAYMYEELGRALGVDHYVLAPDLPGHGDSDPMEEFGRQQMAASVEPLLASFGVGRRVLIGASLGGMTSITYTAAHPDDVVAIVLIDVGHRLEEEGVRKIIGFMQAHDSFASLEEAATEISAYLPHRKEVRPESLSRNLRQRPDGRWVWKHSLGQRIKLQEGDERNWQTILEGLEEEAASLRCPVLILRGAMSDVLSGEGAEEVAAVIPNARLETVDKAGHLAAGDNPASTVSLVRGFLAEIGW
jgi:pimeloyl-ACP methyl ester carboxylesterase